MPKANIVLAPLARFVVCFHDLPHGAWKDQGVARSFSEWLECP